MKDKTLTLSEWGNVAELVVDRLTRAGATGVASGPENAALLDLLTGIAKWQDYFAVDGESAAHELCTIAIPAGLPLEITAAWSRE